MKNEMVEFFTKYSANFDLICENAKKLLSEGSFNLTDEPPYALVTILYQLLIENKLDLYLSQEIRSAINDENNFFILSCFIKEEKDNIIDYFSKVKTGVDITYPKLVDFEWKFVGLATREGFEVREISPKIILKLLFNNGESRIIESDFSNIKKLHEEIEENLSAFNSTYARRIETFAK